MEDAISMQHCYELITQRHILNHGKALNLYELIRLGIKEDDYHYINYLMVRRLTYMKNTILKHTLQHGVIINLSNYRLFWKQLLTEEQYSYYLSFFAKESSNFEEEYSIDFETLVKTAAKYKQWEVICYAYYIEKKELFNFITEEDRKHEKFTNFIDENAKLFLTSKF